MAPKAPTFTPNKRAKTQTPGSPSAVGAASTSASTPPSAPRDLRKLSAEAKARVFEAQPRRQPEKPPNADIQLCVTKYTDVSRTLWPDSPPAVPLWGVRLGHAAWPSLEMQVLKALEDYLVIQNKEDEEWPKDLKELRSLQNIAVCVAGKDSHGDQGLPIQAGETSLLTPPEPPSPVFRSRATWSVVIWVAGDADALSNALMLLDSFIMFRAQHPRIADKKPWPAVSSLKVKLHLPSGMTLPGYAADDMSISTTMITDAGPPPLSILQAPPPFSNRIVMASVDIVDANTVVLAWDGRTYPFREKFDVAGLPRVADNLRVLPEDMTDMSNPTNYAFALNVFNSVLENVVCHITIPWDTVPQDGKVLELLTEISDKTNIFTNIIGASAQ
ncbi:unnamed protein product [Prorocentrum cordatum]|uniref:Uncharacterized protein n=1 Tax=Prorocentrum cordatum TaxID=2364126 RepID=A0ABN9Q278_9DINO|nr:unnamed protein product [Polarella glacialis]